MLTEHQKHLVIGAVVLVGGGILIWYLLTQNSATPVSTNAADTAPAAGDANPGALPGYMNYNVPAYNPGSIPVAASGDGSNSCCNSCAGGDNDVTNNIQTFAAVAPVTLPVDTGWDYNFDAVPSLPRGF